MYQPKGLFPKILFIDLTTHNKDGTTKMKKILIIIIMLSTILYSKDYREYYENGQLKVSGVLKDGVGVGKWFEFYENGRIKIERNYVVH